MLKKLIIITLVLLSLAGCEARSDQTAAPQSTSNAAYLENKGSDTMVNLALAWAEAYQKINPEVNISVTGGGSGTGITALINHNVDIANASREIKGEEKEAAERNGVQPVEHVVARDAIAIIVNPHNPVSQLTIQQISDIYRGITNNWAEVGGEDRPIVRLSRETNSGTHVYFLEQVLRLGEKENKNLFSMDTLLLPSSEGITAEVRDNPNAIGYDGLGYVTPEVKMIALSEKEGSPYVLPSVESVDDHTYPIARNLFMYTDGQPIDTVSDYLGWILSPEGQGIVVELGFIPIATP